ncbi:Aste57867_1009 [Aphanomyces stellatus]|uniref:Aste57867_1009 protein n=1 Tax=Aphanomyces stellatus TaxID=120398 RepID=A0A485K4F2_9STRA|nr:hypothetical protein As57867_001008 [Aphanomyces stellatus]VFT78231.1 Aste57867_1009 [Aphanomyces stellatus]
MWGNLLRERGGWGGLADVEMTPRTMQQQRERIQCRKAHLWTVFKSWRYSTLRKKEKRDRHRFTDQERDIKFIYEEGLLLHDLLTTTDKSILDHRLDFVMYIYNQIHALGEAYTCETSIDRQMRTVLHYAVLLEWDIDDIAWVVRLYPDAAGMKDCDGFSPLTYATLYGRRDEIILQLAVPLARAVQDKALQMFRVGNFDGSKRLFLKATDDFLAGVPHFDQHLVEDAAATLDVKAACVEIQSMWSDFIAVWGHFDPPLLVVDLPPKLRVTLGSRVLLSVQAKGEPLSYQWFCNDTSLDGCTSETLDVTGSAIPEDQGTYFCRLTNWRGSVDSTASTLLVLDDSVVVDPSTRYYRTTPLEPHETLVNVNASVGAVVDVDGVQLFVPPFSFNVMDLYDTDLASTAGVDIVLGLVPYPKTAAKTLPPLGRHEWFVSALVELSPTTIDPFLTPCICRLPHSSSTLQLAVLQLVPIDADGNVEFRELSVDQFRVADTYVDIDLMRLGTFVVVQRAVPDDDDAYVTCRERMSLFVFAPSSIPIGTSSIDLVLWLCPTRLECCKRIVDNADTRLVECSAVHVLGDASELTATCLSASLVARVRAGESTCVGTMRVALADADGRTMQGFGLAFVEMALHVDQVKSSCELLLSLLYHDCKPVLGCKLLRHVHQGIDVAWAFKGTPGQQPVYFVVEMAVFSKTFWDRYKDIWWFERGNLSVVDRMYKIVHIGPATQVFISTDVHAASIRVAACNGDTFGAYCDNILVTPDSLEDDDDDFNVKQTDTSVELHDSQARLERVIASVYTTSAFQALYGLAPVSIVAHLEAKKTYLCASHYDVMLLVLGLGNLVQTASKVYFHRRICHEFTQSLAIAKRLVPALDVAYDHATDIIHALHTALQAMTTLVQTCTAAGWFARFLVADPQVLHHAFADVLERLVTTCNGHVLFASADMQLLLLHWENRRHALGQLQLTDGDTLRQLHAWSLLLHEQHEPKRSLGYFSTVFQTDMLEELASIEPSRDMVQANNTLKKRLVHVFPAADAAVPHTAIVTVRFDGTVIDVDCLRFITVKNTKLKVRVNGNVTFERETRTAVFTPTVALEARSTFKLKLRAEAVRTWYGPLSSTLKIFFTTKPK